MATRKPIGGLAFTFMNDGSLATGHAKVTRRSDLPTLFKDKTLARYRTLHPVEDLDARHAALRKWIEADQLGTLDVNETKLDATFLQTVFGGVLGYQNRIEGGLQWQLEFQENVNKHGRRAVDGALGFFSKEARQMVAAIECKGVDVALDIGLGGVKSPVEQAWDYANRSPGCRWVIVSNLRETWLYNYGRGSQVCQKFLLRDLADREAFARFCLIFQRSSLLPDASGGPSLTERLLDDSARQQQDLTQALYADYKAIRARLFDHLCKRHSNRPAVEILRLTQTLLDRYLFVAFACQRDLLPETLLSMAMTTRNPFDPQPLWNNLRAVFRWIDSGKADMGVPGYNGGLFRTDPGFDDLDIADDDLSQLARLNKYNFRDDVSVEVLGHIFEQSISDLERMRAEASGSAAAQGIGKRDLEGVVYTPGYMTRFIVHASLGRLLLEKRTALKVQLAPPADAPPELQTDEHWRAFNLAWKDVLLGLRIVDPACGSGAFLVAAYDFLAAQYEKLNKYLARLGVEEVDLTEAILQHNLFGVDLNAESVEITRLSLWLKTAVRGRKLTDLDRTIRQGNSVVSDPEAHPLAFDWLAGDLADPAVRDPRVGAATPDQLAVQARWAEGFDAVLGNPPYVRQEWLDDKSKAHWKREYQTFSGVADLYVYFFERGLKLCKPGGVLGFITNNKWLRAGYGEPLRRWLSAEMTVQHLVDFGHARIFEGTDTFPSVLVARRQLADDAQVRVCIVPREVMNPEKLDELVAERSIGVERARFLPEGWTLEGPEVDALMERIRGRGVALKEYVGCEPRNGLKTGFNDAYLIDAATAADLEALDPRLGAFIRPYLRGQDIDRWTVSDSGLRMIVMPSSNDRAWPWAEASDPEAVFKATYPVLHAHFCKYEAQLKKRQDHGKYWWELRPCAYYDDFAGPKIVYQEIQFRPHYALNGGFYGNNTLFFLPTGDLYLLGVLNSPLIWWFNWRHLVHAKDEALRPFGYKMATVPIARPTPELSAAVQTRVAELIACKVADHEARGVLFEWLRSEHGIDKPGSVLHDFGALMHLPFEAEVKKRRPKAKGGLTPLQVQALRQTWQSYVKPAVARRHRAAQLEAEVARLVEQAYGLTADDVRLMWETAPVRMPGTAPGQG